MLYKVGQLPFLDISNTLVTPPFSSQIQLLITQLAARAMTAFELKDVVVSNIKPFEKSEHPATLEPSVFDLPVLDCFLPVVYFYRPEDGQSDSSKVVANIKESLSKVLVPFFPFAGRWVKTYDARIRELQCTDEGVPFIEASVDEELDSVINTKDYEAVELLGSFHLLGLDPSTWNQHLDISLPAIFMQVTKFKCGGIALQVALNHTTADGEGVLSFMKAWSEIALHGQTSIVPVHDRSLSVSLGAFLASSGLGTARAAGNDVNLKEGGKDNETVPSKADPGAVFLLPTQKPNSQSNRTLHVKREVIERVKQEAAENNLRVSTVDIITAHIWLCLNNVPENVDGKKWSTVGSFVEGRKRFHSPPLPDLYTGNVVAIAFTPQIPPPELATKSLLSTAKIVHDTMSSVNWQACLANMFHLVRAFDSLDYRQIDISSWVRFPFYKISFGGGYGNPFYFSSNVSSQFLPLGLVLILPPAPSRADDTSASLHIVVQEKDGAAQALLSDPNFLSLFHVVV